MISQDYNSYFINENVPSYHTQYIGVFDDTDKLVGYITYDADKPEKPKTPRLSRIGVLSDIDLSYGNGKDNFRNALKYFVKKITPKAEGDDKSTVDMICICGNITGSMTDYKEIIAEFPEISENGVPIYTCAGLLDAPEPGQEFNEAEWKEKTGHLHKNFSCVMPKISKYNIIMFSTSNNDIGDIASMPYTNNDLYWLDEELKRNSDKVNIIFTNLFMDNKVGNANNVIPEENRLIGTENDILSIFNKKYKNAIFVTGNSLIGWEMQQYDRFANIRKTINYENVHLYDYGWNIHIPGCAATRELISPTESVINPTNSEGAIIDIYENVIYLRGVIFKKNNKIINKYCPLSTYRMPNNLHDQNPEQKNYLYTLGVEDNKYVDVGEQQSSLLDLNMVCNEDMMPNSNRKLFN